MMNAPRWYWYYHCFLLLFLMTIRYFEYRKLKYHYFLLDFCYFTNVCLAICRLFELEVYKTLFNAIFICSVGPLPLAVVVWKISFVFHDHEKVTSVLIHILPLMLCYTMRWHGKRSVDVEDKYLRVEDFSLAAGGYLLWQIMYYLKTEVQDKHKLDADREIQTSLRWITTDKKNPFTSAVLRALRVVGIMGKDEVFEPSTFKTKAAFMTSQFVYTLATFSVAPLVYYSKTLHLYAIGATFIISTYLGASYYIEIFSKRYQKKFEETQSIQNVVRAAAEVAFESATSLNTLEVSSKEEDLDHAMQVDKRPSDLTAFRDLEVTVDKLVPLSPQRPSTNEGVTPMSPLVSSSKDIMRAAASAFVNEICEDTYGIESTGQEGDIYDDIGFEEEEQDMHDTTSMDNKAKYE